MVILVIVESVRLALHKYHAIKKTLSLEAPKDLLYGGHSVTWTTANCYIPQVQITKWKVTGQAGPSKGLCQAIGKLSLMRC